MPINFPNRSRSYDPVRARVRFWGYDSAMEVAFFVEEEALFRLSPGTEAKEEAVLKAFDDNRSRIIEIAGKTYSRKQSYTHTLAAKDFFAS